MRDRECFVFSSLFDLAEQVEMSGRSSSRRLSVSRVGGDMSRMPKAPAEPARSVLDISSPTWPLLSFFFFGSTYIVFEPASFGAKVKTPKPFGPGVFEPTGHRVAARVGRHRE